MTKLTGLIILIIFIASGCTFKKANTPDLQPRQDSKVLSIYEKIYTGTSEELEVALKEFDAHQINSLSLDEVSPLDAALMRGNPSIAKVLLQLGASPFRPSPIDKVKPYRKIHSLNSPMSNMLGNWVANQYTEILTKEQSYTAAQKRFDDLNLDCNDLLNLHAYYSSRITNNGISARVLYFLESPFCKSNLNFQFYDFWIKSEVIALVKTPERDFSFIKALQRLKGFQNLKFDFQTPAGILSIDPASFIRLAAETETYRGNFLEKNRLTKLVDYFDLAEFPHIEIQNKPLPRHFSLQRDEDKKLLSEYITFVLSDIQLSKSENCYWLCNLEF